MKISIVIPNWNGAQKLKKHLLGVVKTAHCNKIEEIIVVDDGSSDDSVDILKKDFPDIFLIPKETNSGFSSTVNLGVKKSSGDLVILLNNDAQPTDKFLEAILPHFNNSKVFSVGCNVGGGLWARASFKDGFLWHSSVSSQKATGNQAHQTLWVSGGSGVFRRAIWDELGGFDELFDPFYEEDVDLGYRATKRGYLNIWEPASLVEHYQEKGVIATYFPKDKIEKIAQRNQLLLIWKNITSSKLMVEHRKALVKMLVSHLHYWPVFVAALTKLPFLLPKREIEKQHAKLADEEIFALFV